MAHQLTPQEVDELAADAAKKIEPTPEEHLASPLAGEMVLAYGAEGENVTKLVNVLTVLGFSTNSVVKGGQPILDVSVLEDVKAAQLQLGVIEPAVNGGVEGELVGTATFTALYEAAAAKLEAEQASA
jgi:hypothetical protein